MQRSLPLLLTTATLAAALAACGPTGRARDGAAATGGAVGTTATTGSGPVVKAGSTAAAAATFHGSIATGRDAVRERVRYSWRRGCPLRNPYVTRGGRVSPPAGRPYANRARRAAGMIHADDTVVRAFAAAGWRWGGSRSGSRDYQHFSSTGR
jgi:D-alanyl-D-alanine carboxypeptidase